MRKSITFDGLTISYLEKNEVVEQTIFFLHGNSGSAAFWQAQLDDPALKDYRLIAFDLPAHGHSSIDPACDYGVMGLGKTMSKAVGQLACNSAFIMVAISLGTNIVAEMLNHPVSPTGIVFAGPCILGDEYTLQNIGLPTLDPVVLFSDEAPLCSVNNYYKEVLYTRCDRTAAILTEDHLRVKAPFRSTLISKALEGQVSNELELLRRIGVPLLIVFGKEDMAINPDYLDEADLPKWNHQVYKIPEAGHLVSLEQPKAFNDLVLAYAGERFTGSLYSGRSESVPMHS